MNTPYTHLGDMAKEVQPTDKGMLSRTLYNDEWVEGRHFQCSSRRIMSRSEASSIPLTVCASSEGR